MRKLVITLFLIGSFCLNAQQTDSVYTNIFSSISDYRNHNEVFLGNIGLAKFNLFSPFDDNNTENRSLFRERSNSQSYTDIFYVLGTGQENYFDLIHNQKLTKDLQAKVSFFRSSSTGIYSAQAATVSNFSFDLGFNPEEKRYNFDLNFRNYKRYNDINGGVADSTFFSLLDSANANVKTTFPVQMPSAIITSPNNSELEMLDMSYSHSYNLSKTRNDSLGYFQLAQTFQYKRTKRAFNVLTNTDFFSDFNYDSVTTADSMKLEQLTHQIGVEYHKTNLQLSAGIGQNYYEYLSYSPFEVHWENYLYANLSAQKDNFSFSSDAVFITSENKYESFNVANKVSYVDTGNQFFDIMEANFNFGTNLPELYFDDYVSNHFQWSRTNNRNTIVKADFVGMNTKAKAKVTVNFESHSDAIFWDSDSQIGQTGISVFGITLEKQFQFGKRFFFSTSLRLQDVVAKQTIEVPNVVSFSKFFFKGKIFRKQLSFDAGINLLYYSSFYSKAYNPALDKFYVQDQQKVGNYPILDVFAEFYLKNSFAFFVTLTHANSGLLLDEVGKNYLATTNYPRQDRAFKFGLKWRLFD